ncbi:MAG: radical SAM protein [Bacteroidales bacterium]|nr:radical SAM protein [Bacteroidales bacterium]
MAQMLSVFDGKRTMTECLSVLENRFELSRNDLQEILDRYIENREWINSEDESKCFLALENMLIQKGDYERVEYYKMEDFPMSGKADFSFRRNHGPVVAIFELTMRCYTDCVYCYADRRNHVETNLSTQEILDVIRQMKQIGVKDVSINGGEVLLHPDIKEILQEMVRCGYYPLISTKYPVEYEMLEFLHKIGITQIQISIDSINPDTLSSVLKVDKDYFEKIRHTMKLLDEMRFHWQTNTILTKYNSHLEKEVKPLFSFLTSFKHIRNIRSSEAGYSLYKTPEHYRAIKARAEDLHSIALYIDTLKDTFPSINFKSPNPMSESLFCGVNKKVDFQERAICTGNEQALIVLPDGKVTICEELYWHPQFLIGDLRENTLAEIWNGKKALDLFYIQQNVISESSPCKLCHDFKECRHHKGVCWKMILQAYGMEQWDQADPRCPDALPLKNEIYYK